MLSKQLCLRYIMKHPVGFREFWVPQVSKRPYWGRYAFLPIILSLDLGDALLAAGRGGGKSYSVLEPELVRAAINAPGEETMISTFRKEHVKDRMERVIEYFEMIPLFRSLYLKRVLRSPTYHIQLHNSHNLYGISVGDDPEAKMAQGKHVSRLIIEEAHQYPERAWMKIQGAKDPRGCKTLMAGVPDGQIDTPFRRADKSYESFAGRRIHISRRYDPWFNQEQKRGYEEQFQGIDSDLFKQEIDAEWGSPTWSAWNLDLIYACVHNDLERRVVRISGKEYTEYGYTPEMALRDLPGRPFDGELYLAADIGYTSPTELGAFLYKSPRWHLVARVQMVNRTEHDAQAAIFDHFGQKYGAYRIGIDTTEGLGRAIAHELEQMPRWASRVDRITFSEMGLAGYTPDGLEVKDIYRDIGTMVLRKMFAQKEFALPRDEDIVTEFNQEKETRGADGKIRVITPPEVHITDMMRVLAVMLHLAHPPIPPNAGPAFCMPDWGEAVIPWRAEIS